MAAIRVIVGVGNPGAEYLRTRHNIGFWFVDTLAAELGVGFRDTHRFHGKTARAKLGGAELLLLKPDTLVNRSGLAVRAVLDYFKHAPEDVLVVHDELDLPPGTVRVKRGGGHGGHNGLRDIIGHIGPDFARLRFGIGRAPQDAGVIDYVLGVPSREDEEAILAALGAALAEMPKFVAGDFDAATRALHNREETKE